MQVLLTGGNSGIGFSILQYFLLQNCTVTVIDNVTNNLEDIKSSNVNIVNLNLLDLQNLNNWCEKNNTLFDVVVNCAGIREITPVLDLSINTWQNVLTINLTVPFLISRTMARKVISKNKELNIINIASISGLQGEPNRAAYCASKHGLIGLTKQMAIELGPYNIRVNSIAPGIIRTQLTENYFHDENISSLIRENTPLRKWGKPENIVSAVKFILENDFVTGSVVIIDGGWVCGKKL